MKKYFNLNHDNNDACEAFKGKFVETNDKLFQK